MDKHIELILGLRSTNVNDRVMPEGCINQNSEYGWGYRETWRKKEEQVNKSEFKVADGSKEAMLIGGDIKILREAECPKCWKRIWFGRVIVSRIKIRRLKGKSYESAINMEVELNPNWW